MPQRRGEIEKHIVSVVAETGGEASRQVGGAERGEGGAAEPARSFENGVLFLHIAAGRKCGEHVAGERRAAGDAGERGGRGIELHQIERAGLEGEIAGIVIDVPGMPGVPGAKVEPEWIVMVSGSNVPPPASVPPL